MARQTPDLQRNAELQLSSGEVRLHVWDRTGVDPRCFIINTLDKAFEEISLGAVQSVNKEQACLTR